MAQKKALVNIVKTKLSLVTSQKEELYGTIDACVDKVTAAARLALDTKDPDVKTFSELSTSLETVLAFIVGLGAHVDDATSEMRNDEADTPNERQALEMSQNTEPTLSDKVTQQETRLRAVEDSINQVDGRVSTKVEEIKTSLMAHMAQRIAELEKKQSDTDKQYNMRLEEINEQLKQMGTGGTDMMKQSESRLDKVEKQMKKLEAAEKQDASRLDNAVRDIDTLRSQHSKRQQSTKLDSVAKQVETLSIQCCSLQEQLQDTQNLKQTVDDLASRLGTLADKSDLIDVMKADREMKNSLQDVTSRLVAVESSVKSSLSHTEKEENKRREMEDRMLVLESNRSKDLDHYAKKLDEVESKLNEVAKQAADNSTRIQTIETKRLPAFTGFTAYLTKSISVKKNATICSFGDVHLNEGDHFNSSSGTFTAPHDGFYIVFVCLAREAGGHIDVAVWCERCYDRKKQWVCCSGTDADLTSSCGVGAVHLCAGDKLSVQVTNTDTKEQIRLSHFTSFTCFSIG